MNAQRRQFPARAGSAAWTEIQRIEPHGAKFRASCTEPGCHMQMKPLEFMDAVSAEAWATDHANRSVHTTVVEIKG